MDLRILSRQSTPGAAVEALIMAAEGRGPVMHSRIGVLRALNRRDAQRKTRRA